MEDSYVELQVKDGGVMRAFVARPDGDIKSGIILFQEAFGVNAHIRDMAERFAKEGYLSIAPELFHRTAPGFESEYVEKIGVAEQMTALTDEGLISDAEAAYAWLKSAGIEERAIGAVGYCMGGRTAYLANTKLPLAGVVSYYGGGIAKHLDLAQSMHGPLLMYWGGKDTHIPQSDINAITDKLTSLEKAYTKVVFSYAGHGFSCDARASYNKKAASEARAMTLQFLANTIGK